MSKSNEMCGACRTDVSLPSFTMAFQPIVDIENAEIYAYEPWCVPRVVVRLSTC